MLNKKIFISISILFLVFNLLIISSALELNPFAEKKIYESTLKEDMSDFLKEDFNSDYGVIRLSKTFFWIETDKVAEYSLTENTDQCLINCKSKGKAILYTDGKLFDDKYFLNKKGIQVEIDSQYYIKEIETYYEDVPQYKEVCSMQKIISNNTLLKGDLIEENVCTQELTGYEKEERTKEVWNEYNFEELKAGNYEWEIRGSKAASQSVDFIPTAQGKSLNEWAWWNSDWEYKREITNISGKITQINVSYNPNMNQDFSDLRFLNSSENEELNFFIREKVNENYAIIDIAINEQESIYLYYGNEMATSTATNLTYSLDESTGTNAKDIISSSKGTLNSASWGTTTLGDNLVAYWGFNDGSSTSIDDSVGSSDVPLSNTPTNVSGKIGRALKFNGINQFGNLPHNDIFNTGSNGWTISTWINFNTARTGDNPIIQKRAMNYASEDGWGLNVFNKTRFGAHAYDDKWWDYNYQLGEWVHLVATYDGATTAEFWINGISQGTQSVTQDSQSNTDNIYFARHTSAGLFYNGSIDETGFWNRKLLNSEILSLYNNGNGLAYGENYEYIKINLTSPLDNFETNSQTIFFNATITPINVNITNITWRAGDQEDFQSLNTNESITLNWTKTFDDGEYSWNITACSLNINDETICSTSETRSITIDTTAPTITANLNETILYSEGQEVGLEYNITDSNLGSCWYTYNDINTSINCSETSATITTTLSALDVIVYANDSVGNLNQSETLSMTLDPIIPEIILSAGNETEDYYYSGINHTINFTITDDNLDSIWWEYNGLNTSISPAISGEAQSISFEVEEGVYTATIYTNDTIGNLNQLVVNWNYGLIEDSITFNPTTIEGSIENYYLNLTLSGLSLISATFHYDGISQISQIEVDGNERFVKIEDFEVPAVTTDEDKEFYWTLVFSDGTILNSTFNNQSVTNIGISGCGGSYTYRLIDLYLKDEETTDTINGYIEVDYSIFNPTTETIVQNYSYLFEDVNTASICSDLDLSDSDFLFDAQIRYYATNYSSELYNIQMGSLETLTNLSLYYLAIDDSTEFLVTYQDENAIRVEGAIIQLLRKYVSKGIYRVVEAPETSADGTAVLHIDLNSVIYDVIVVKDGVELDRFENVVFACDSAYSTLCTQNLYGTLDPGNSIPIETIDDFSYTLTTFNDSIKLTYSITSGVPSDINMILEQIDSFGSKINCNESVTSSGGSIECGFNETIGDSIVKVLVLRDEEPVAIKSYVLEEDRRIEFLGNNYFIALIILLSVVAMAFSSPEWIVMNGVFTMLILGGLTLVRGLDFTIGLGSLMWLIIAGAILVMKISKQEDR